MAETPNKFPTPYSTVDVVIFTVREDKLHVLLTTRPDDPADPYPKTACLPGGYINIHEDRSLLDCALRKLREKTGVDTPYLEQLGSWGSIDRDPRGWTATHAYFALIPPPDNAQGQWYPVDMAVRKKLAFDHNNILAAALERLRGKVEYTSLPAFLLAEPFTLPDLQHHYEIVLGRRLDKSAFRKRMLDAGWLEESGQILGQSGRSAAAYRIRDRRQAAVFPRSFKSGE